MPASAEHKMPDDSDFHKRRKINKQTQQDKSKPNNSIKIVYILTTKLIMKLTTLLQGHAQKLTESEVQKT